MRLLVDHRDDLVEERKRIQKRLRWHCHDLEIGLELPARVLDRHVWLDLLEIPGCSALRAAHILGQTAGFSRFKGDATFAMHVGCAPLPVSSGKSARHRLNRCGNRKLNSVIHMIALTQAGMHPPAMAYMERKQAEGMSYREALRCLKRLILRAVFKTMLRAEKAHADKVVRADFGAGSVAVGV